MKRPTWATMVGVIGILIGCLGFFGGGLTIMTPKMIDIQKNLWTDTKTSMEEYDITDPDQMPPAEMMQRMEQMWDIPDWFNTFCLITGVASTAVCIFYIFSCIRLLQISPTAIRLFYTAAGVSIGFSLLKSILFMAVLSFMGMGLIVGSLLWIVANILLLIVVATKDKQAFSPQED